MEDNQNAQTIAVWGKQRLEETMSKFSLEI